MNPIKIDFTGAGEFKTIPDGTYVAKCVDCQEGISKKGDDMLVWQYEVVEGPHKGTKLKDWTLCGDNPFGVFNTIKALTGEELDGEHEIDGVDYVGLDCVLIVATEEYDGRDVNSIKRVDPFDLSAKPSKRSKTSKKKSVPKRKTAPKKPVSKKKSLPKRRKKANY